MDTRFLGYVYSQTCLFTLMDTQSHKCIHRCSDSKILDLLMNSHSPPMRSLRHLLSHILRLTNSSIYNHAQT